MTIFDTIKYANIDIYKEEELKSLPPEVLNKWSETVRNFSIDLLTSLSSFTPDNDLIPEALDVINDFIAGNIDNDIFEDAVYSITKDILRDDYMGIDNIDYVICLCIWDTYYSLTDMPLKLLDTFHGWKLVSKINSDYAELNFDAHFKNKLMVILTEFNM